MGQTCGVYVCWRCSEFIYSFLFASARLFKQSTLQQKCFVLHVAYVEAACRPWALSAPSRHRHEIVG